MPFCRECGKDVQDDWKTCPHCSCSLTDSAGINLSHDNNTIKEKFMRITNVLVYLIPFIYVVLTLWAWALNLSSDEPGTWYEGEEFGLYLYITWEFASVALIPLLILIHTIRWKIKWQQSNIKDTATQIQNIQLSDSNSELSPVQDNNFSGDIHHQTTTSPSTLSPVKNRWNQVITQSTAKGVVEVLIGLLAVIIVELIT